MFNAYCSECATRVTLAEDGSCSMGHSRSALRDVREGGLAPDSRLAAASAAPAPRDTSEAGQPGLAPSQQLVAQIVGKTIVIVPAGFMIVLALWSSYAVSVAMGMSKSGAWWSSVGSLVLTGAMVALWVAKRRMRT